MLNDSNQIECPYCAEIILAKAKKCKHCGEMLYKPAQSIDDSIERINLISNEGNKKPEITYKLPWPLILLVVFFTLNSFGLIGIFTKDEAQSYQGIDIVLVPELYFLLGVRCVMYAMGAYCLYTSRKQSTRLFGVKILWLAGPIMEFFITLTLNTKNHGYSLFLFSIVWAIGWTWYLMYAKKVKEVYSI